MSAYAFSLAWPWAARTDEERGRQGRLAVVDVPDRAHVDVGFGPGESFLGHVTPACALLAAPGVRMAGTRPAAPHADEVHPGGASPDGLGPAAGPTTRHRPNVWATRPKSCRWDLNPGPRPYQGRALPTEPRQHCFERLDDPVGDRSASNSHAHLSGPRPPSPRAGDGNRTHVACLEGRYSTIELHPRDPPGRDAAGRAERRRRSGHWLGRRSARRLASDPGRFSRPVSRPSCVPRSRLRPDTDPRPDRTWVEQDSNLRRHCHQIYSLAPLATWVSTRVGLERATAPVADPSAISATRPIDAFADRQSWR